MPSNSWFFTGGLAPPEGLIIGLKQGESVPGGWSTFSSADGYVLKGTDSDVTAGTTDTESTLSLACGSGGSHSSGTGQYVGGYGGYTYCNDTCRTPTRDPNSQGAHAGHDVTINFEPAKNKVRLVQAGAGAAFFNGAIMFSLDAKTDHTAFTTFNSSSGFLAADTTTESVAEASSANSTDSASNSHDHVNSNNYQAHGAVGGYDTGGGTAGGSHTHTGGTPSITNGMRKALLRAWELVGASEMEGMIGMYIGSGTPDGWAIVTEVVDYYVGCDAAGTGQQSGDNTLNISGTTGNTGHSHSFSGSDGDWASTIQHSNSVSHGHSYSDSAKAYEPTRYHIKFIKYTG